VSPVIKYSFGISAVYIILKLVIYHAAWQNHAIDQYSVYLVFLILLAGIYFGMREMLKQDPAIDFKNLIKSGSKIAALAAIFIAIFTYAYYTWIDVNYFPERIRHGLLLMKENGNTAEEAKEYYLTAKYLIFAPDKVATFALFGYLLMGIFYSLISCFLLRKRGI
jgi:hypothetical protein